MQRVVLSALVPAIVAIAGCAGPEPPQVRAEPVPACEPYRDNPTAFARCRLFALGLGDDLVPEAGRAAGLDAQVRCAPLRTSPEYYGACIEAAQLESEDPAAVAPGGGPPASTAEAGSAEADDPFAELLEEAERLDDRSTTGRNYPAEAAIPSAR